MEPPRLLDESFGALIFDWDGTAVADCEADASAVRTRVESLCAAGIHLFVVSGTNVSDIDGQLRARPAGRGRLHLCCNRGSEVFEVTRRGPVLRHRRVATAEEDWALDEAASLVIDELHARGLDAQLVTGRLNGRKIDLIPEAQWAEAKKAEIEALLVAVNERLQAAGIARLADVVALASKASEAAALPDACITSDVKHIEIGITDKSDSARYAAAWLAERGITGGLVLLAGDEFGSIGGVAGSDSLMRVAELARAPVVSVGIEPGGAPAGVTRLGGGPTRFLDLLDAQLARRADGRVPGIDHDPLWVVGLPPGAPDERVGEALGAIGNGWAGTRGSREDPGSASLPLFGAAGVYGREGRLLHGPIWTTLRTPHGSAEVARRFLDLRTGVLARADGDGNVRSARFVSADTPYAMALRAEGAPGLSSGEVLQDPDCAQFARSGRGGAVFATTGDGGQYVAVAANDRLSERDGRATVERLAAWHAGTSRRATGASALRRLARASGAGFDVLLADHRAAWAQRWRDADVVIEGPGTDEDQLGARFALFHLLAAAKNGGEAAVGARGVTGDAYDGHVFWDADVFVLPALAAIRPAAARAMLEYRVRRLPAARAAAAALGRDGARFPWESAGTGSDVTPRLVHGARGEPIVIRTGTHEEHICADVAWAAARYATWAGDETFMHDGPGRDLVVETARYWASRVRLDRAGRGHIYGVMGPDEYHEIVDDNAYTNVMARWNLEEGAALLPRTAKRTDAAEAVRWRALAASLVDGWNPARRLYEQFAGYFGLEPLLVAAVAEPPVAADMVLGAKRVAGSQLIKQADVLMLHHLLPTAVEAGSLIPCLDYYEPRTAHGSSLSPAISASLLARAGRPDAALPLYRLAARIDLDDLTRTTAGGLHLATMGGLWQALAYGFLGLHVANGRLAVDPHLPAAWSGLSMRFRFRGNRVEVRARHGEVAVFCDAPAAVRIGGREPEELRPPGVVITLPANETPKRRDLR